MQIRKFAVSALLAAGLLTGGAVYWQSASVAKAQEAGDEKPFGDDASVEYAAKLLEVLKQQNLMGEGAIRSKPYEGKKPHGNVLETLMSQVEVDGHTGDVWVKQNYGGEGVSAAKVWENPDEWLKATTVMFKREDGYDADNANWFWVKYAPDGSVAKMDNGMAMAGRVAKGMDMGCIACHGKAEGGDYIYTNDAAVLNP